YHAYAADARRARGAEPHDRRPRHGGAAPARPGRLRALRVRLSQLPGPHGVPGGDRAPQVAAAAARDARADVAAAERRRRRGLPRGPRRQAAQAPMSTRSDAREDLQRDTAYMLDALALAARGEYDAKPNPAVGCVLVNDGKVVGSGWSAPAGGPHAEIVALRAAGEAARGATVYVTLEPCCHQGRTGPCTRALIDAGVARVVFAAHDPNPRVAGGGSRELAAAGIAITAGVLESEAILLYRSFFSRMQRGRPWVVAKIAASLDGRTALANGASRWITGDVARRDVHRLRARAGAILTGSGTVIADDPALTA